MKSTLKLSLNLFLRAVLVCMLSFMAVITLGMIGSSNGTVNPVVSVIFGIIYFFMLMYFFVYTAWVEGCKDRNRVAIGQTKEFVCKGFFAAAIVTLPIIGVFVVASVFEGNQSVVMNIFNLIKLVFCWAGIYFTVPFTGGVSTTTIEGESTLDFEVKIILTCILCAVYFAAFIGAGIGYIFGYKKISFIPAIINRITGRYSAEKK